VQAAINAAAAAAAAAPPPPAGGITLLSEWLYPPGHDRGYAAFLAQYAGAAATPGVVWEQDPRPFIHPATWSTHAGVYLWGAYLANSATLQRLHDALAYQQTSEELETALHDTFTRALTTIDNIIADRQQRQIDSNEPIYLLYAGQTLQTGAMRYHWPANPTTMFHLLQQWVAQDSATNPGSSAFFRGFIAGAVQWDAVARQAHYTTQQCSSMEAELTTIFGFGQGPTAAAALVASLSYFLPNSTRRVVLNRMALGKAWHLTVSMVALAGAGANNPLLARNSPYMGGMYYALRRIEMIAAFRAINARFTARFDHGDLRLEAYRAYLMAEQGCSQELADSLSFRGGTVLSGVIARAFPNDALAGQRRANQAECILQLIIMGWSPRGVGGMWSQAVIQQGRRALMGANGLLQSQAWHDWVAQQGFVDVAGWATHAAIPPPQRNIEHRPETEPLRELVKHKYIVWLQQHPGAHSEGWRTAPQNI